MMNEAVTLKSAALRGLAKSPFTSNLLLYHSWQTVKEERNCRLACSSDRRLRANFLFLSESRPKTLEENWRAICLGTHLVVKSAALFFFFLRSHRQWSVLQLVISSHCRLSVNGAKEPRSWAVITNHTHTQKSFPVSPLGQPVDLLSHTGNNSFFTATLQLIPLIAVLQLLRLSRGGGPKRSITAFTHLMGGE